MQNDFNTVMNDERVSFFGNVQGRWWLLLLCCAYLTIRVLFNKKLQINNGDIVQSERMFK